MTSDYLSPISKKLIDFKNKLPNDSLGNKIILYDIKKFDYNKIDIAIIGIKEYRNSVEVKSNFSFSICKSDYFNDLLTSSFSINNDSTALSEELTDEFDLQSFAGSISATEDLLSGSNDTPIIKLINGIISQAVKNRASDIHFEPYEESLIVRFRVDGILKGIEKPILA